MAVLYAAHPCRRTCTDEMEGIIYATEDILFRECFLGGVYVPCITCMPGAAIGGDSGLCCCVPIIRVTSTSLTTPSLFQITTIQSEANVIVCLFVDPFS